MTRLQAADRIAEVLSEAGYSAKVWSKGSAVRVYLDRKYGYLAITGDGTVEPHLDRQKGTIVGCLPDLEIESTTAVATALAVTESPDDPMERLEHEANRNLLHDPLELG